MRVLNSRQMRDADRRTIEEVGIPSIVLMENAGRQVVAAMESAFEQLGSMRVAILCGRGNNGGVRCSNATSTSACISSDRPRKSRATRG
jgi:ADP-dependent NAD(P)H-hydrate dehydratase / NAD(P)H-hydrate epimerase